MTKRFTPDDIRRMTPAEFRQHEAAIMRQSAETTAAENQAMHERLNGPAPQFTIEDIRAMSRAEFDKNLPAISDQLMREKRGQHGASVKLGAHHAIIRAPEPQAEFTVPAEGERWTDAQLQSVLGGDAKTFRRHGDAAIAEIERRRAEAPEDHDEDEAPAPEPKRSKPAPVQADVDVDTDDQGSEATRVVFAALTPKQQADVLELCRAGVGPTDAIEAVRAA